MNDQINESISAMVDGQTDDLEVRRMLKALDEAGSDAEVQALMSQWERYQIIGANIRGEQPAVMAAPRRKRLLSSRSAFGETLKFKLREP